MVFCKVHSTPIFNDDGEHVGWTEPTIIQTQNKVVNNVASALHLLDCGTEIELPDGTKAFYPCRYTAQQMRENAAAAMLPESTTDGNAEPVATPAAVKQADALGVDLSNVEGHGEGGTITKPDVTAAAEAAS